MDTTIALLTDFGLDDAYVGVMKGVIAGLAPQARLVDITHAIPPQDVRQGALTLADTYPYFPTGTIFLVVIDPGVGTARRPIAVQAGGYHFIAPDNGVLSYALTGLETLEIVALNNPAYRLATVSQTFHGRDVFAPAAAHLAAGVPLSAMGEPLAEIARLPRPQFMIEGSCVTGEVVHIDRFGNIVTSIQRLTWQGADRLTLYAPGGNPSDPLRLMAQQARVDVGKFSVEGIQPTYGEVPRGELVALVGSSGALEIAINQGHAARRLDVAVGDRVELHIGERDAAVHH